MNICTFPAPGSLGGNRLGVEGCKVVAAVLPETQLKELRCASARQMPFVHRPVNICTFPALSIAENFIRIQGCEAIAALLPNCSLTNLKCARPALSLLPLCSAPRDILHFSCTCSLSSCLIGNEVGMAMAAALSSSSLTNLKCVHPALSRLPFCSAPRVNLCTFPARVGFLSLFSHPSHALLSRPFLPCPALSTLMRPLHANTHAR